MRGPGRYKIVHFFEGIHSGTDTLAKQKHTPALSRYPDNLTNPFNHDLRILLPLSPTLSRTLPEFVCEAGAGNRTGTLQYVYGFL